MTKTNELKKINIEAIIEQHEKMRNSYFWNPPMNAGGRRQYEDDNSIHLKGEFNGHELDLECSTSCSCKNIYYKGSFYVDGQKVTIRKIKNLLK